MTEDGGSEEFDRVVDRVRERVTPDNEERTRLEGAADRLLARTREAVADLPVDADVLQVGSTARDTWVSGDRDVDVFVRFPPDLARDRLEELGLQVGHAVLPEGREEYAEHPYVKGSFEGFDVDLVPCYRLADASEVRSAVDRTPFHTEYLTERLDDRLAGEVRVCKAFLKGIGVYGSDLRTRGVGGYLAELLVLHHGGVRPLFEAAAEWHPPVRIDPGDTGSDASFDDPLVVIDPTDPDRNVASVVAEESLASLQHHARDLLADPREALFEPRDPDPLDAAAVRDHLRRRGTAAVAVTFPAPDVVDDQLYPQLRRAASNLVGALDRAGFRPVRSETLVDRAGDARTTADDGEGGVGAGDREDRAALVFECAVRELSAIERHEGPPVAVREHAKGFYGKYDGSDAYGPFCDGDRYVVERQREHTTPSGVVRAALSEVGLGPDVERAVESDHAVLVGDEVAHLAEREGFGRDLRRYFEPRP